MPQQSETQIDEQVTSMLDEDEKHRMSPEQMEEMKRQFKHEREETRQEIAALEARRDQTTVPDLVRMIDGLIQGKREYITALDQSYRDRLELATMVPWVIEQRKAGRPEAELTWGNCVVELGILQEINGRQVLVFPEARA